MTFTLVVVGEGHGREYLELSVSGQAGEDKSGPLSQMQAFMNHLSFRLPSSTQHSETYTCERMCLSHLRRAEIDTLLFRQWLVVKQCQQVSLESLIERIAWLISSPHLSVFINQKLHVNGIECVCVCVIVCH